MKSEKSRKLMTGHWAVPVFKKWAEEEETVQDTEKIQPRMWEEYHNNCCPVEAKG